MYENVSATKHKHCGTRRVGESFILVQEYIPISIDEIMFCSNMLFFVTLCFVVSVPKLVHFTFSSIQIS
jgi:hypothetical protein